MKESEVLKVFDAAAHEAGPEAVERMKRAREKRASEARKDAAEGKLLGRAPELLSELEALDAVEGMDAGERLRKAEAAVLGWLSAVSKPWDTARIDLLEALAARTDAGAIEGAAQDFLAQLEKAKDALPLSRAALTAIAPCETSWLIRDWLLAGELTLLGGHGGSGKSYVGLELACAVAAGVPEWGSYVGALATTNAVSAKKPLPVKCEGPGTVFYATYEDAPSTVLMRSRRRPVCRGRNVSELPDGLHVFDLAGRQPLWAPRQGGHVLTRLGPTPVALQLESALRSERPRLLIVDSVAAAFGSDENSRQAVRSWLGHLSALARETGCAILLIAHLPKTGSDGGTWASSGSTDWAAGCRATWLLEREPPPPKKTRREWDANGWRPGLRLTLNKSNRSAAGQSWSVGWTESERDAPGRRYGGFVLCSQAGARLRCVSMDEDGTAGAEGANGSVAQYEF